MYFPPEARFPARRRKEGIIQDHELAYYEMYVWEVFHRFYCLRSLSLSLSVCLSSCFCYIEFSFLQEHDVIEKECPSPQF
jgi:hypothetical protein